MQQTLLQIAPARFAAPTLLAPASAQLADHAPCAAVNVEYVAEEGFLDTAHSAYVGTVTAPGDAAGDCVEANDTREAATDLGRMTTRLNG